jgi:hypothetical protein
MFVTYVSDIVYAEINVVCVWCANVAHWELWIKFIHGVLTHIVGNNKTKQLNNFARKTLADYFLNVSLRTTCEEGNLNNSEWFKPWLLETILERLQLRDYLS